ncbi:hypothetical protein Tco_0958118 [Tanacetum coccineum]
MFLWKKKKKEKEKEKEKENKKGRRRRWRRRRRREEEEASRFVSRARILSDPRIHQALRLMSRATVSRKI